MMVNNIQIIAKIHAMGPLCESNVATAKKVKNCQKQTLCPPNHSLPLLLNQTKDLFAADNFSF